jgi:hypothetical protein
MAYRDLVLGGGRRGALCPHASGLLLGKERADHVRGRDDRDGDRERRQALRLGGRRRRGRIGLCHNRGPALRRTVRVELLRQLHGVVDALQVGTFRSRYYGRRALWIRGLRHFSTLPRNNAWLRLVIVARTPSNGRLACLLVCLTGR